MTPNQYKSAIASLGLSQEKAGVWLGYAPRTSQGWAIGEFPVPQVVSMLLRLTIETGRKPEDVKP